MSNSLTIACIAFASFFSNLSYAQDDERDDSAVAFTVAAATEREMATGNARVGATLGFEVALIEHWLELEVQVSALGRNTNREYTNEFILKKPFRLSKDSELEVGLGAFISRPQMDLTQAAASASRRGNLVMAEFKKWTSKNRGWFIETSLGRTAGTGEKAIGVSAGLIFGL